MAKTFEGQREHECQDNEFTEMDQSLPSKALGKAHFLSLSAWKIL